MTAAATGAGRPEPLLEVNGLKTHFFTGAGVVKAVDGVDLPIARGRTVCVAGESGCGKSVTARSILQLVDRPGRIVDGEILLHRPSGEVVDLAVLAPGGREMRAIRGKEIAMILQDPTSALSPVHTIGDQITEMIRLHAPVTQAAARTRAAELLDRVGIPRPGERLESYVLQLSGGLRRRAMIAMALACEPYLLIADAPTSGLDVTTEATILDLIRELQRDLNLTVLFCTHDLGVVAEIADDVVMMYLGWAVERAAVDTIFHDPKHPYTRALHRSIPQLGGARRRRLQPIRGTVPPPFARPGGCRFHPRCESFVPGECDRTEPPAIPLPGGAAVRCLIYAAAGSGAREEG